MTAEIAVLNKTAVALAADSAMTISAGHKQEKIFDTADKLFELSLSDPIGIMIYNGMTFMGIPLPVVIKEFRAQCAQFEKVQDAADSFLNFLQQIGKDSPASTHRLAILSIVQPLLERIDEDFRERFFFLVQEAQAPDNAATQTQEVENSVQDAFGEIANVAFEFVIVRLENGISKYPLGDFVGGGEPHFDEATIAQLSELVANMTGGFPSTSQDRVISLIKKMLASSYLSAGRTGLVIAGFGSQERFPTLVSYEIDGIVCGKLKFKKSNFHDIDREGDKAVVLPFAQKEMVDRFLYGLDDEIQKNIYDFCRNTVGTISQSIVDSLNFAKIEDKDNLLAHAKEAEKVFLKNLKSGGFSQIIATSKSEIEEMVEFMPKPELAKMAEALIDLTSIKRRVSKGMETVGGAVDVAVISKSDGFVWIKRKHYFPPELNVRFFDRTRQKGTKIED